MGYIYTMDGECIECKRHTTKFCDACHRYVCDDHRFLVEVEGSAVERIFCKKCYSKGKQPRNASQKGLHPQYGID
jgi:sulfur carrier protein ThiS